MMICVVLSQPLAHATPGADKETAGEAITTFTVAAEAVKTAGLGIGQDGAEKQDAYPTDQGEITISVVPFNLTGRAGFDSCHEASYYSDHRFMIIITDMRITV